MKQFETSIKISQLAGYKFNIRVRFEKAQPKLNLNYILILTQTLYGRGCCARGCPDVF